MFIVFAKGEIIMNNIYKVIWSKAKNCYVVASEIARSHTKSASGSGKIGGVTRRSLLASLMALSLLCGGLGVASAADGTVHVADIEATATSKEVYTAGKVDTLLANYGTKTDVDTNKDNIKDLQNTTTAQGQKITENTTNIANNKALIDKKIDAETADAKLALKANVADVYSKTDANDQFATKEALNDLTTVVKGKADTTALNGKADTGTVKALDGRVGDVEGKVTTLETKVGDASGGLVKDVADLNNKLGNKVNQADLDAATNRIAANEGNITNLQKKTEKLSADGTELKGMTTVSGTNVEAGALKVTGEISDGAGVNTTLTDINDSMTQTAKNKADIATLQTTTNNQQTAIDDLKQRTKEISYADGDGTRISGVTIKDGNIVGNGNSAITELTNVETDRINGKSLAGTTVATEKEVNDEKTAREKKDNELEEKITKNTQDIATLDGSGVKYDNAAVKDIITLKGPDGTKITNLKDAALSDSSSDAVTGKQLNKTNKDLKTEAQTRKDMDTLLSNRADALEKNTGGITRNDAKDETYIEKNVTVDNQGNITAKGKVTANGAVNAGSLNVTDASHLKGDVTMDKKLAVTGDTSLKKTDVDGTLNVTGESSLKDTQVNGTLTTTGKATFKEAVEMDKGLTVTNGDTTLKGTKVDGKLTVTDDAELKNTEVKGTLGVTGATTLSGELTAKENATFEKDVTVKGTTNLKNTTVEGNLKVTGTITTDRMVFGDPATNNYTEIDHGKVTSKNLEVRAGGTISSLSTFDVEKNEVSFNSTTGDQSYHKQTSDVITDTVKNNNTGDQSFHKQTSDVIMDNVKDGKNSNNRTQTKTETKDIITDEKGNSSTTSQTASENKTYLTDKDRKNTNSTIDTAKGYDKTIKGENGETSTKQDELNITNTAQNGTIKNEAKDIVNNATGDMTNTVGGKLTTTVTGQATENFNGGLNTKVTGAENHTVTGKQTNTVEGGQENIISGGQENIISGGQINTITGGQINNITGDQTTNVSGDISNTAKNITNAATETLTDKVGDNTRVTTSTSITDTVGTANRKIEDGKITDTAGDFTVTTDKANGTTFAKTGSKAYSTKEGAPTDTNIAGNHITTGRVDANELGVSDKDGANTAKLTVEAGEDGGVKASAGNGTTTGSLDVTAKEVGSSVKDDASGKGSTFKQRIDKIMMESKDVSIKAEETLTNEAKVITNKASEVINNEAVNINNTATGIINSKASEIKNQADKLISNKVGENTSEYMEDGKITTSVKDGAKSTVTIQNADGLQTGVTNGTSTNASATTATSSAQTIASGNKANSVITTIDGTQFVNTDAAVPVNGASGAGTAVNTKIKGNTITTGKVTMDYAEVMKDLGVHGNTTLGEAGKDTTLTVNSKATFKENATFEKGAEVKNGLTVSSGESTFNDKVTMKNGLDVTGGVASDSFTVKGTDIKIDSSGINAGGTVISNVADGSISEGSKDAVNGGQLYQVKNDLEGKVNKVGANAAAMANLHPMEFDPDSKWNIAAAMGNYGSETATAIGAFYRPNEDVMVNFSTAFGTGENMVGGGVSVRLGKGGNKLSREENNALKDQVNDLTARMDALLSVLNPNMSKDFPDVPENHWAYEAVSRLAGNDIVQGYPDGEFHGERTMTRYEMAEIIYNALSRGAEAEKELVEEFKPELQAMAASEKATAERAEG